MRKIRIPATTYRRGGRLIHRESYLKKDTGKPGKTPLSKRFSKNVKLPRTGWKKTLSASIRRSRVLRKLGTNLKAARYMQFLANRSADRATDVKALADAKYFFEKHRENK